MIKVTAAQLATILGGTVEGNPEVFATHPAKIEEAGLGSIAFLGNAKYEHFAYSTEAAILLVGLDFAPKTPLRATLVRVENVYAAVAILLEQFNVAAAPSNAEISSLAFIHATAHLGKEVSIGAFAVVEAGVQIADNVQIGAQVFIGKNAVIGAGSILFPGVKVYHDCQIGTHCVLHSNAVIGSDGFGFAPQADGTYLKIAQVGNVVLENDVEVGACTVIDRATMGSTIIRQGVKLDNLIQIAHNVEVGQHTVIAAQSAVAGSSKVGAYSQIGGQTGISGHLTLPDRVQMAAKTGIMVAPEEGARLGGAPAMPFKDFLRASAIFRKLPELLKRLEQLEKGKE